MIEDTSELRRIPQVDALIARAAARADLASAPRSVLAGAVRALVDEARSRVLAGADFAAGAFFASPEFLDAVEQRVSAARRLRHEPVINATGILLHTGLGRAPLGDRAIDAAAGAGRYAVVEVDPDTGERDLRESRVAALLCELTGAEAATAVNNNAAATLLALAALAAGREVVVSRGELVEIGGGFRMPDVMAASGCRLREVGTTNRTYARDYAAALGPDSGLVLKVHTSNFRILGFTVAPAEAELVALARARGVPFMHDLGSGLLRRVAVAPLEDEPTVTDAVAAGADVVTFSGDKLLCGPQAGLVVGRRASVDVIRRHPLFRAVRPGKLDLAALEATLLAWRDAAGGPPDLPLYRALARRPAELLEEARALAARLAGLPGVTASARATIGFLGSGSAPVREVAGAATAVQSERLGPGPLAERLRRGTPRVFARIDDGALLLEARTLFPGDADRIVAAFAAALELETP